MSYTLQYNAYADAHSSWARVIGIEGTIDNGVLTIPAEVEIDGTIYPVQEIGGEYDYELGARVFAEKDDIERVILQSNNCQIGYQAFQNCTKLLGVWIQSSIGADRPRYSLGSQCFSGCSSLTTFTLQSNGMSNRIDFQSIEAQNVSQKAFENCTSITYVLGGRDTNYILNCFYGCSGIKNFDLYITEEMNDTDDMWFDYGIMYLFGEREYKDGDFTITNSLGNTEIKFKLFAEKEEQVSLIPDYFFYKFPNISQVFFTAKQKFDIGSKAFYGCYNLTDFSFSSTQGVSDIYSIGNQAFAGTALGKIDLSRLKTLESIDREAFSNCLKLSELIIPNTLSKDRHYTSLGSGIVYGCKQLTSITIPFVPAFSNGDGNRTIKNLFTNENHESSYPDQLDILIFNGKDVENEFSSITTDSLTAEDDSPLVSISKLTFNKDCQLLDIPSQSVNLPGLKEVLIQGTIANIEEDAFEVENDVIVKCPNMKTFQDDAGVFRTDIANFFQGFKNWASILILPDRFNNETTETGITYISIPAAFFKDFTKLKYLLFTGSKIESEIKLKLGAEAFSGCTSLIQDEAYKSGFEDYDWTWAKGWKLEQIIELSPSIFYNCNEFTGAGSVINSSITVIPEKCFAKCQKLANITANGIKEIGQEAFYQCGGLLQVNIELVQKIGQSAFEHCAKLLFFNGGSDRLAVQITHIGESAFAYCSTLTEFAVSNLMELGAYAFRSCTKLKKFYSTAVTNYSGITEIPTGCFYLCSQLNYISLLWGKGGTSQYSLGNVTTIGGSAFSGCSSLSNINLSNVTVVGVRAFESCSKLKLNTTRGDLLNVTSIGSQAFSYCSVITTVINFPFVTEIADRAFEFCSRIEEVTLPSSLNVLMYNVFRNCENLSKINFNAILDKDNDKNIYYYSDGSPFYGIGGTNVKECKITIGKEVVYIPKRLFYINNTDLTTQVIFDEDGEIQKNENAKIETNAFYRVREINYLPMTACSAGFSNIFISSKNILETLIITQGDIPDNCFSSYEQLKNITFGCGVTSIGNWAISYCTGLEQICWNVENSDIPISMKAFAGIGHSNSNYTDTKEEAFNDWNGIELIIGPQVTKIKQKVFNSNATNYYDKLKLSNIDLTNCQNLIAIEENAFESYWGTESTQEMPAIQIYLPESVIKIHKNSFTGCENIQYEIDAMQPNQKYLGTSENSKYHFLMSGEGSDDLVIKADTVIIAEAAINSTGNLIIESLEARYYGDNAFDSFTGEKIFVPQSFSATEWINTQYFANMSSTPFCNKASLYYLDENQEEHNITTLSIEIEEVPSYAFYNIQGVLTIRLAKNIQKLSSYSLYTEIRDGGDPLSFYYDGSSEDWKNIIVEENWRNSANIIWFQEDGSVTSPESNIIYRFIDSEAPYYEVAGLTEDTTDRLLLLSHFNDFPVKAIGERAFQSRTFSSIVIPLGYTKIEKHAFNECKNLVNIEIDPTVEYIGEEAFKDCDALQHVAILRGGENSNQNLELGERIFSGCDNLKIILFRGTEEGWTAATDQVDLSISENTSIVCSPFSKGLTYNFKDDMTCTVINLGSCNDAEIIISPYIYIEDSSDDEYDNKWYTVTGIEANAFKDYGNLKSLSIPKTIITVGLNIVQGCSQLESLNLTLLPSVTENRIEKSTIGLLFGTGEQNDSFYIAEQNNTNYYIPKTLNSISLNNIEYIAPHTFKGCHSLTEIIVSEKISDIGEYAFAGCEGLIEWSLPSQITQLKERVFENCNSLVKINNMKQITSIADYAFNDCISLSELDISNVTTFGKYALRKCAFTELTFNSEANLTEGLCQDCKGLSTVRNILGYFTECGTSTTIIAPFAGCINIENLIIKGDKEDSLKRYRSSNSPNACAPYYIGTLFSNSGSQKTDGYKLIEYPVKTSGTKKFLIPNALRTITINGGNTISYYWLYGLDMITSVEWNNLNTDDTELHSQIPEKFAAIGYQAFKGCAGLNTFTIPEAVTFIGAEAFLDCSGLTSITLPKNLRVNDGKSSNGTLYVGFGSNIFKGCIKITEMTFDTTDTKTLKSWFDGSSVPTALESIIIGSNCQNITKEFCNEVDSIESVSFEDANSLKKIDEKAFANCPNITEIIIEVTTDVLINKNAFMNCTRLEKVQLSNSVKLNGDGVFEGCTALTECVWNSVSSLQKRTFYGCSSLTEITGTIAAVEIPSECFAESGLITIDLSNVTTVEDKAFYNCSSLANIHWPESENATLGKSSFENCIALKQIDISANVSSIGQTCFKGCSGVTNINIDAAVIGAECFAGCINLKTLKVPSLISGEQWQYGDRYHLGNYFSDICTDEDKEYKVSSGNLSSARYLPTSLINIIVTLPCLNYGYYKYLFAGCASLENIGMHAFNSGNYSTTDIQSIWEGCTNLKNIELFKTEGDEQDYNIISQDGCVYNKESDEILRLLVYPQGKTDATYTIEDKKIRLSNNCFTGSQIEELIITNEDIDFSNYTSPLVGMQNLRTLSIPFIGRKKDDASYTIYSSLFGGTDRTTASQITTLIINSKCQEKIYVRDAFVYLNKIETLDLSATDYRYIPSHLLSGYYNNQPSYLYTQWQESSEPMFIINKYVLDSKEEIINADLSNTNVTLIADSAFYERLNLKYIKFNDIIKYINHYAFNGCSNVIGSEEGDYTITVPDSVLEIGDYAFFALGGSAGALQKIYLGKQITFTEGNNDYYQMFSQIGSQVLDTGVIIEYNCRNIGDVPPSNNSNYYPFVSSVYKQIVIGPDVEVLPKNIFRGVTTKDLTYDDEKYRESMKCESIEEHAFYSLYAHNILLWKQLRKIKNNAFFAAVIYNEIRYDGSLSDWMSIEFGESNSNPQSIYDNYTTAVFQYRNETDEYTSITNLRFGVGEELKDTPTQRTSAALKMNSHCLYRAALNQVNLDNIVIILPAEVTIERNAIIWSPENSPSANAVTIYFEGKQSDWNSDNIANLNLRYNTPVYYYADSVSDIQDRNAKYWKYSTERGIRISNGENKAGEYGMFINTPRFKVDNQGQMVASNANISGTITATSGVIGGCEIKGGKLSVPSTYISGTIVANSISSSAIYSQYAAIRSIAADEIEATTITTDMITNEAGTMGIDSTIESTSEIGLWFGGTRGNSPPFSVTLGGHLTASSATIGSLVVAKLEGVPVVRTANDAFIAYGNSVQIGGWTAYADQLAITTSNNLSLSLSADGVTLYNANQTGDTRKSWEDIVSCVGVEEYGGETSYVPVYSQTLGGEVYLLFSDGILTGATKNKPNYLDQIILIS